MCTFWMFAIISLYLVFSKASMQLNFIYELFTNPLLKTKLVVKPPLRSLSFISYKSSGEFDPEAPDSPAQLSVELYRAGARCLNPPTLGPRLPSTKLSTTSIQEEMLHAGDISTRRFWLALNNTFRIWWLARSTYWVDKLAITHLPLCWIGWTMTATFGIKIYCLIEE